MAGNGNDKTFKFDKPSLVLTCEENCSFSLVENGNSQNKKQLNYFLVNNTGLHQKAMLEQKGYQV